MLKNHCLLSLWMLLNKNDTDEGPLLSLMGALDLGYVLFIHSFFLFF